MTRPEPSEKGNPINCRVDGEMLRGLYTLMDQEDRSMSNVMRLLLAEGLYVRRLIAAPRVALQGFETEGDES